MANDALLVIDMLNDFASESGVLFVPAAKAIIPALRARLERARAEGVPVVYVCDAHSPDDPEMSAWPPHAIKGTPGAQVVPELEPRKGESVVEKRTFSAFYGTDLEEVLRALGAERLILTGTLTDICVYHAAADAFLRGYRLAVPRDSVAALSPEDNEWALRQMKRVFGAEILE